MANAILLAFELLFGCGKKFAYDRSDIGGVVAQRRNLDRDESLQESYATLSLVPPAQQERVKVA